MARSTDAIVIGSGHNALVAAAYLAKADWEVDVFERNSVLGGTVATEELTLPGYRHDTFSAWHPLFMGSAAFAELGDELADHGLHYVNTDVPTAVAYGDGEGLLALRDPAETAAAFKPADARAFLADLERFGGVADVVGELLGTELYSRRAARLVYRLWRRLGRKGLADFTGWFLDSAQGWLTSRFSGHEPDLLWAPWILHTGLSPSSAGGAFQLTALAGGVQLGGMPVVQGGSINFVRAFQRLIEEHGGTLHTDSDVVRIICGGGRAHGVMVNGQEVFARKAVIASVTPTQLYGRLLDPDVEPQARQQAQAFRYGRGDMQVHLALSEPLRWKNERVGQAAIVHIADGSAAVELACAEANAGLLPAAPTVVVGQPTQVDPSRAPSGGHILWLQLQETPFDPKADAAGELEVTSQGWTPQLREGYVERVINRIAEHAPNVHQAIVGQAVLTPVDLQARNINLQGGDPYAGAADLAQSFLWRPLRSHGSHRTSVDGLWQIGASTYPGPGLNAASGRIVAQSLLGRRKWG